MHTVFNTRYLKSLQHHRAFKLILGGSFTDAAKAAQLAAIYAQAGVTCIDMAPDSTVVMAVTGAMAALPAGQRPTLMVSLPLDPDPHFQKIELTEPDCITCGACLPICPTQALSLPVTATDPPLLIDQPLCYGCGRCLPLCPTEALALLPNHPNPQPTLDLLANPAISAVEIHTTHADTALLPAFLSIYGDALKGKLIAICFQPSHIKPSQWLPFVAQWQAWVAKHSPAPLVIQVDGNPMGGTHSGFGANEAPVAAIQAAWQLHQTLTVAMPNFNGFITLSGGMNQHAGPLLVNHPVNSVVAGIGVGTVARQWVWHTVKNTNTAIDLATKLTKTFTHRDLTAKKP